MYKYGNTLKLELNLFAIGKHLQLINIINIVSENLMWHLTLKISIKFAHTPTCIDIQIIRYI